MNETNYTKGFQNEEVVKKRKMIERKQKERAIRERERTYVGEMRRKAERKNEKSFEGNIPLIILKKKGT